MALPLVVLTSMLAAMLPPGTVIMKALLAYAAETKPNGSSEGVSTVSAADQVLGAAGSFHTAKLAPREGTAPTVPPKFTLPLVADTNALMPELPEFNSVG